MTFSIMLWMPSWGGMINGLMTLSGAWDKLRTDPVLRMLVVSVAFYGMSTFEGPVMSVKIVNALSHYTDWTIGHVHSGALGWVGFVSFGALYCLVPWLWGAPRALFSLKLVDWHFWIATIGIVFYISAMWVSGIMQGLMWRAYTPLGFLEYSFIETVEAMHPFYVIRALGGALFLVGALIMAYNLWMTVRHGEAISAAPAAGPPARRMRTPMSIFVRHQVLEKNSILLLIGILLVIAIGGIVEITPLFYLKSTIEKVEGVRPYTPLELAGRNIYVREGCYLCHSQMIRPLRDEVERYGHYASPPRACTTTPSSGARSAPVRTWPASAASIPTSGTSPISPIRARSCRPRSCRATASSATPISTITTSPSHLKVNRTLGRALHRRADRPRDRRSARPGRSRQ